MAEVTTLVPLAERPLHERVAATVRAEIARYGIRQRRIAEALGMTQQSISGKLRGSTPFTLDELAIVASMIGTTVTAILADSESPRPHVGEDGGSEEVRHQGLEPRTRWLRPGHLADIVDLGEYRREREQVA